MTKGNEKVFAKAKPKPKAKPIPVELGGVPTQEGQKAEAKKTADIEKEEDARVQRTGGRGGGKGDPPSFRYMFPRAEVARFVHMPGGAELLFRSRS